MKIAILRGCFLISILILSACGGHATSKEVADNLNQVYTLDLNVTNPDSSDTSKAHYYAYKWLPKELEERSGGRIKVNVYFDGQLAQLPEMLDALKTGAIDMGYATMAYYGDQVPEAFVTSFPYLADGLSDDAQKAHELWYSTEIAEIFDHAFKERGLTPLMHTFFSPVGWMVNKPIQQVDDMDGLIVAAYGGLFNPWYEELGVVGVDVPPTEWYHALSRGIVQGVPSAFITLDNLNLKEVIDYVLLPAYDPVMSTLLISSKTLEGLPEELQKLIFEVSKEAELLGIEGSKDDVKQVMKSLYEFEEEGYIEIIQLPDDEVDKFYERVKPMFNRFGSMSEGSARIVEIIQEFNKK